MIGLLDKTQYGSTPFGLVHCVYEVSHNIDYCYDYHETRLGI